MDASSRTGEPGEYGVGIWGGDVVIFWVGNTGARRLNEKLGKESFYNMSLKMLFHGQNMVGTVESPNLVSVVLFGHRY